MASSKSTDPRTDRLGTNPGAEPTGPVASADSGSRELSDQELEGANGGILPIVATAVGAGMIGAGIFYPPEEVPIFDDATKKKLKSKS